MNNTFDIGVSALDCAPVASLAGPGTSWRAGMPVSAVRGGVDVPTAVRLRRPPHVIDTSVPEPTA